MIQQAPNPGSRLPDPDEFDHQQFKQCFLPVHDLGGQADGPLERRERPPKAWEVSAYVICECLAWRGVWTNVEKLRRHADLREKQYLELPYSARWLVAAARALVDKDHITQTELLQKMDEVRRRYAPDSRNERG